MRPFEQRRYDRGCCIQCNKPKTDRLLRCPICREKVNTTSKRFYREVTGPQTRKS